MAEQADSVEYEAAMGSRHASPSKKLRIPANRLMGLIAEGPYTKGADPRPSL